MGSSNALEFTFTTARGSTRRGFELRQAIIAGWTGRDVAAMEKHIHELEEIGVPRPRSTPMYYRVGARRITTADCIEASGGESSGEVEFVILNDAGRLWVGVGSDHTDRKVETYGITVSKQMCDKPVAPELWPLDEVEAHWDSLQLRATATIDGAPVLYQDGTVAAMRTPRALIELYEKTCGRFGDGALMFGGTLAAIGGIRPADRFEVALTDPVLGRRIVHGYDIERLPIVEWE